MYPIVDVIIGTLVLFLPVAAWLDRLERKGIKIWIDIAAKCGLTYHPRKGIIALLGDITGDYKGHHVEIYTEVRGSGDSRQRFTIIELLIEPPLDLGIRKVADHISKARYSDAT